MRFASLAAAIIGLTICHSAKAGDLNPVGSGDGMESFLAVANVFMSENPGIRVAMPPSIGSSGGIAAVASGTAVLGRIARPLSDKDKALGLIATPVFRLPATIFVHPSAKVEELTVQQLAGIFSGAITNWNEVGGADLRIRVIRREEGESALSTIRASLPVFKDLAITPRSKLESTTPAAFETLLATEGAIFIASYSTSAVARGAVPLCIEGRKPLDGGYPATLTIGFVHREETVTPEARVFLAFATSAKARDAIMKAGSAVPVN